VSNELNDDELMEVAEAVDHIADLSRVGVGAKLRVERLVVPVTIKEARPVFGRIDYLVSPVNGGGEQWVSKSRLVFDEK